VRQGGAEAFKKLQEKSKNWLNYLADKSSLSSPEEKANFVLRTKKLIASMNNAELKKQYLNLLNERFGADKNLPVLQAKKTIAKEIKETTVPEIPWKSLPSDEIWLVSVIFRNPELQAIAIKICDPCLLSSRWLAEMLDYGYALFEETGKIDLKVLYDKLPASYIELLNRLPEKPWTRESAIMDFSNALLKLRISRLKAELKETRNDFDLYKEIQGKIKYCEDLAKRAKNEENVLGELK
jgi:DNA primase